MTPLRRFMHQHRLRNDWLAAQTGMTRNRVNNLSIGYGRWRQAEADATLRTLAHATGLPEDDLARQLFAHVEIRPDKAQVRGAA